jgi:hypothetical protein
MIVDPFWGYSYRKWLTEVPEGDTRSKIVLHHIALRYGPLPEHDEICVATGKLTAVGARQPELALVLLKGELAMFGIIAEELRWTDEVNRYAWPALAAALRARLRCPVCVLVTTDNDELTRWAREPIELGGENRFRPYVLEPLAWRQTVDLLAKDDAGLALLSAILHGREGHARTAAQIARDGIAASVRRGPERSSWYRTIMWNALPEDARRELQAIEAEETHGVPSSGASTE